LLTIQLGERWTTVTRAASSAIAGTTWIALAPPPTTTTRLPSSETEWSHSAEWNWAPANDARPSTSGSRGRLSCPVAQTSTSTASVSPPSSWTTQVALGSSKVAATTSAPKRMWSRTPPSIETSRRYSRISGWDPKRRDQSALRWRENW
jgi:hypothetical protein